MSELKTNLEQILQEKNEKIISQNIKKDVEVLNVVGSYDKEDIKELQDELADAEQELADVRRDLDNSTATVSGSGENITLSGTAEARFKKAPLPLGNTEQEVIEAQAGTTVEGESINASGIDLSKVEILNINGNTKQETTTGTNLIGLDTNQYKVNLSAGDKLTITNNTAEEAIIDLYSNYGDTQRNDWFSFAANSVRTVTLVNDAKAIAWRNAINGIAWCNLGETATSYEPYTGGKASPNPDYPQEAYSAGANMNLFDKQNATSKIGYIKDDNGNDISFGGFSYITLYTKVNSNTTYTLSGKLVNSNGTTRIYYYDKNKNWISRSTGFGVNVNVCTFITPQNCEYIQFQYINEAFDIDTIKLEEGSQATAYSAYNQGNMNVEIHNKNLFDKTTADVVEGYFNSFGEVVLGGTSSVTRGYIPIIPNTDMILSGMPFTVYAFYDENKNFIERIIQGAESYAFNKNARYMRFQGYTADFDIDSVQLERGSTATAYVAHEGQNITIPTQAPFRKIGNTKDTFVKKVDGKWYEKHVIGEVILDGSELNWLLVSSTDDYYEFQCINVLKPVAVSGYTFPISSYFSNLTNNRVVANTDLVLIRVSSVFNITTVQDWKTWLSTHNVIVNYVQKEPIYTECTSEQSAILEQINTFYETTNIFSTDEVSPNFTFTYNKVYASPSPDDESPIQTVSGDVEVKVQNKNLAKEVFDQKLSIDGTGQNRTVTSTNKYRTQIVEVKPNTNYVISGDFSVLDDRYMRIGMFDDYPIIGSITTKYVYGASPLTFTTDTNTKYILLYNSATVDTVIANLQLELDSTPTSYVSHQEQALPLSLKSKNLFKISNYSKTGWNITIDNPLKGLLAGNYTLSTVNKYITANKGMTIYFSDIVNGSMNDRIGEVFVSYEFSNTQMSNTKSITQEQINAKYLIIGPQDNLCTQEALEDMKIMIEQGSVATSYVPYYNYELCKIGDYQDYFWKDETTSKWYLHKEMGLTVFDGSETWYIGTYAPANSVQFFTSKPNNFFTETDAAGLAKIKSSHFINHDTANGMRIGNSISFFPSNSYNITTEEDFKTWLSTHNVTIEYALKTPADIEITNTTLISQLEAIRKAISYDEQTNVSSNTIALFDIIALRNMNTILNTLENEIELLP